MEYNKDNIDKLLSFLKKDKFNSLSFSEQNEVIDDFIDFIKQSENNNELRSIYGGIDMNGKLVPMQLGDILEKIGREKFKETFMEIVKKGGFNFLSLDQNGIKDLIKKAENGTITKEEELLVRSLSTELGIHENIEEEVDFATFAILKCIGNLYQDKTLREKKEISIIKQTEPVTYVAFSHILSCLISDSSNVIGKMYLKHGLLKVIRSTEDLCTKLTKYLLDFFKENKVAPERALLALAMFIKTLSSSLDVSLDNVKDDEICDYLQDIFTTITFGEGKAEKEDFTEYFKTLPSKEKSANADIKETPKEVDLKTLLMDD